MNTANMGTGDLNRVVDIEEKTLVQNTITGAKTPTWSVLWSDVPANIDFRTGKEYIAAQAVQSEITCFITIRYRDGLRPAHRIVQKATERRSRKVFNIRGIIPDSKSGLEWLTMPCSEGVDQG
jgi:SPP1 family predicted phage head-tail adaptor